MKEYHVKLIQQGNQQTLPIPTELNLDTPFVIIRQENNKLIIEPSSKKSLIEVLSTLEPLDEDFPDIDEGLLPIFPELLPILLEGETDDPSVKVRSLR